MKYIKKLTWLLVLGAGLMTASCSDNDDVEIPGGLAIDKEQIEIGARAEANSSPLLPLRTG